MKLSEYVKQYRMTHGLSLRSMAEKCKCSYQYLSKLENNEIETPQIYTLANLAEGMGMTVHELLETVDDMTVYTKTYHIEMPNVPTEKFIHAAAKLAKNKPKNDLLEAYEKADPKTQRAVRIMLGME